MRVNILAIIVGVAVFICLPLSSSYLASLATPDNMPAGTAVDVAPNLVATVADQVVGMLTTLVLSNFVLGGIIFKIFLDKKMMLKKFEISCIAAFVICQAMSLCMGYFARLEALTLISLAAKQFDSILQVIAMQALFLHFSFAILVTLASLVLLKISGYSDLNSLPKKETA